MTKSFFSRRTFLKGMVSLSLIGTGIYLLPGISLLRKTQNRVEALTGDMPAFYVRHIITADPATTRRIMWQSETPLTDAAIQYHPKDTEKVQAEKAVPVTFSDDGQTNHQYSTLLSKLMPDTEYNYRLVSSDMESGWYTFRTAQDGSHSFKVLIFPDSQSSDYSDWAQLAQNAWKRNADARFFVNMGDIVDNGEDHTQWQAWFDSTAGIIDTIPFAPLMGNHETYDRNWKVRLPEAYLHYFDVPDNQSVRFSRYYYSFDYGDIHFIVLNSQWDETNEFQQGLLDEQLEWLRQDAQKSTAHWKVALIHKDVLQYRIKNRPERREGFSDVGEVFMPLFDELGIDLVLTAHLHTYRNRGRLYHQQPSTNKGPLYILTGVAGNVRYPNLWTDHAFDQTVAPQPESDNYLTLEATPDSLTVACFLPDGSEIDRTTIRKS